MNGQSFIACCTKDVYRWHKNKHSTPFLYYHFISFRPFSVTPEIGTLPVQESMQVTIEYTPQKTGDHNADLVLTYDTGMCIEVLNKIIVSLVFIDLKSVFFLN